MAKSNKSSGVTYTPELNKQQSICNIAEVTLNLLDVIDYKPAASEVLSMGKITEFKYAGYNQSDKSSVWMNIHDMGEKNQVTEWISVSVWYDNYKQRTAKQSSNDTSKKHSGFSERPF